MISAIFRYVVFSRRLNCTYLIVCSFNTIIACSDKQNRGGAMLLLWVKRRKWWNEDYHFEVRWIHNNLEVFNYLDKRSTHKREIQTMELLFIYFVHAIINDDYLIHPFYSHQGVHIESWFVVVSCSKACCQSLLQ